MIRLSFTGDVMCEYTRLESYQKPTGGYDFSPMFSDVADDFGNSDLMVANLETPLAGEGLRYSYKKYNFNTPDELGSALKDAGVHLVSTANNHVLDRGVEGLERTLDTLDRIGILHTGSARTTEETKPVIVDVKGMRVAVLSYTYGTEAPYNHNYLKKEEEYKVNLLRNQELKNPVRRYFYTSKQFVPRAMRAVYRRVLPKLAKREVGQLKERDGRQRARLNNDIAYARENSDFVVLCLHCGGQYNEKPTQYTQKVVEDCLHQGVNAVIGNHEHRIQGIRLDDPNRFAAYCLGNYSGGAGVEKPPYGIGAECSILLHLYLDENTRKVEDIRFEVLISVKNEQNQLMTKRLFSCIENADVSQKEILLQKNLQAVNAFLGTSLNTIEPQEEYKVLELLGRDRK